jgi:hypothetical protein
MAPIEQITAATNAALRDGRDSAIIDYYEAQRATVKRTA